MDGLTGKHPKAPMVPFKDGFRPLVRSGKTAEAMEILKRYSPTSRLVEQDVDIHDGGLLNKFWNRLRSPLSNFETSWGGIGRISLAPKHVGSPEVLAHELGHERQRQLKLPLKNDKEADYLLNEARDNKTRLDRFFGEEPLRNWEDPRYRQPHFTGKSGVAWYPGSGDEWFDYVTAKMSGDSDPDKYLRSSEKYKSLYKKK